MLSYFTLVDVPVHVAGTVRTGPGPGPGTVVHAVQHTERTQVIRFMLPKPLARQQNINYNYNKRLPRLSEEDMTGEKRSVW